MEEVDEECTSGEEPKLPKPNSVVKYQLEEAVNKQSTSLEDPKQPVPLSAMDKLEELEVRNDQTKNNMNDEGIQLLAEVVMEMEEGEKTEQLQKNAEQEVFVSDDDILFDDDFPSFDEDKERFSKPSKPWSASGDREDYLENCLSRFWRHLLRPEGGMKQTEHDANYVANQVYRMLFLLSDTKESKLNFDVLRDSEKVWDNFIGCKEGMPGKLKTQTKYCYMLSMEKFLNFILNGKSKIQLATDAEKELRITLSSIPGWKAALKPRLRKERAAKKTEKYNLRLQLYEVHEMLQSGGAQDDRALIMNATESSILSIQEHRQARDYLIFMIVHSNAQRAGIGKGLLLSEFRSAEWREEDERYVVLVSDHKNSVDGPAPVVMDKELYQLMQKYCDFFRPIAVAENGGKDCGSFFLTRNGSQVTTTSVSHIFNAVGKKYGRVDKGRLYPTKFRQTAVTSFSRESQQKRDDLSKLMTHRESTARCSYLLEDTISRSITAQKELAKKFMPDEKKRDKQEEKSACAEDDSAPQLPESVLDPKEKVEQWEIASTSTNTIPLTVISHTNRRLWSKGSEATLRKVYGHLLKKGRGYPKTDEILEGIRKSKDEDFQMLVLSLGKDANRAILAKCKSMYKGVNKAKK